MTRVNTDATGRIQPASQKIETLPDVNGVLARLGPAIESSLPRHLNPERMGRLFLTAVRQNPKLLQLEGLSDEARQHVTRSFAGCVVSLCQIGLEPNTPLGHAFLIPRKDGRASAKEKRDVYVATMLIGYPGMVELAWRAGIDISAEVVRLGDDFDYCYGLDQFLRHKPSMELGREEQPMTFAYAIARAQDRPPKFKVMSAEQIEMRRAVSAAPNGIGWGDNTEAMYRKTPVRAIWPFIAKNPEMALAARVEEMGERGESAAQLPEVGAALRKVGLEGPLESHEPGPRIVDAEEAP
jgi:recombination protein RecT